MQPTPALEKLWDNTSNGEELKSYYFSASDAFQEWVNALVNASDEQLELFIEWLEATLKKPNAAAL